MRRNSHVMKITYIKKKKKTCFWLYSGGDIMWLSDHNSNQILIRRHKSLRGLHQEHHLAKKSDQIWCSNCLEGSRRKKRNLLQKYEQRFFPWKQLCDWTTTWKQCQYLLVYSTFAVKNITSLTRKTISA